MAPRITKNITLYIFKIQDQSSPRFFLCLYPLSLLLLVYFLVKFIYTHRYIVNFDVN